MRPVQGSFVLLFCVCICGALKETWSQRRYSIYIENNGLVLIFSSALRTTFRARFAAYIILSTGK